MYKQLEALDAGNPQQRIYPIAAYGHLAPLRLIPILYIEMVALAAHWPLAWVKRAEDRFEPVAVVGFSSHPPLAERLAVKPAEAMPLLLRAYPLALGPQASSGEATVLIDTLSHPAEGHPVFARGELTDQAQRRTDVLWLVGPERGRSQAWSAALQAAGAFEQWRLRLSFEDRDVDNEELYVVSDAFLSGPDYVALAAQFGPEFVAAIEHQILSRQRVQDQADRLSQTQHPRQRVG